MNKLCEELLAGTFEEPLASCRLQQCGTATPTMYAGPGLITQDANGDLRLRVFAEGVDLLEQVRRNFNQPFFPGQLVPETDYYDFQGVDMNGEVWQAKHLSIDATFGQHTYIQTNPWRLEKVEALPKTLETPIASAFIAGELDLPWHVVTKRGEYGGSVDRFEHETDRFKWRARESDTGVWLTFWSKDGPLEPSFATFQRALSILTGRALQPVALMFSERDRKTTRISQRFSDHDKAKLITPIRLLRPDAESAHHFLERSLAHAANREAAPGSQIRLIYEFWHRILRAREYDIENCSLVLSVAIEGLIKGAIVSTADADSEFVQQLQDAQRVLKKDGLGLQPRALEWIRSSVGSALRPRAQDVLRRLIKDGVLGDIHLEAWKKMRHAAAHGDVLVSGPDALQKHIDRFHLCLDLFYRLVFEVIGFTGSHRDLSTPGWPCREICFKGGSERNHD